MHPSPVQRSRKTASLSSLSWAIVVVFIAANWLVMVESLRMGILSFSLGTMGPGITAVTELILQIEGIPPGLWDSLCLAKIGGTFSWIEWVNACKMGVIMTFAMMLPCATPSWSALRSGEPPWKSLTFMASYVAIWVLFSIALASADIALQNLLGNHLVSTKGPAGALAAVALMLPGLYQFTGVKRAARHSLGPQMSLVGRKNDTRSTATKGIHYGLSCLKSNGPLMATMAVLGMMNIVAMVFLTTIMIVEKKMACHLVTEATGIAIVAVGCGFAIAALAN